MGLKDMLLAQGSSYTTYDGSTPTINPLATKYSPLHYNFGKEVEGYSTKGALAPSYANVVLAYQEYNNGVPYINPLPPPSQMEPNNELGPLDPKYVDTYSENNKYGSLKLI
jgi:hypothetical protein